MATRADPRGHLNCHDTALRSEKTVMGHYKSNVRDLEFNMFEVLRMNEALDAGEFGDMDTETAKGILSEVATLTEGPVAESLPLFPEDGGSQETRETAGLVAACA